MKYQILFITILLFSCCRNGETTLPTMKEIIEKDDISIPVYNYDGIEPLFHQNNDTTYVINFWATWCVPCVAELPYFDGLSKKYKDDKVRVLLVSLDFRNKVEQGLIPFLKKRKFTPEVLLLDDNDANTWIGKIDPSWSGAIPATVIYKNKDRAFFEKSFTFTELETELLNIKNK